MALVNCPECGREKVSDTALVCPGCGYAIKEHFSKKIIESTIKEDKMINIPMPTKPKFNTGVIIYAAIVFVLALVPSLMNPAIIGSALSGIVIITGIPIWYFYRKYKAELAEYELSQISPDQYRTLYINRMHRKAHRKAQSYGFHFVVSFLVPLVGFILGSILLSNSDVETQTTGERCIILGIISSLIIVIITAIIISTTIFT